TQVFMINIKCLGVFKGRLTNPISLMRGDPPINRCTNMITSQLCSERKVNETAVISSVKVCKYK
ncbi:MAG TPA: hypothetical protein PKJ85_12670, partial [Nitrosomonas nitrosa]|nr:hypothetical protein [Nitrosomonas nitrosa]